MELAEAVAIVCECWDPEKGSPGTEADRRFAELMTKYQHDQSLLHALILDTFMHMGHNWACWCNREGLSWSRTTEFTWAFLNARKEHFARQ